MCESEQNRQQHPAKQYKLCFPDAADEETIDDGFQTRKSRKRCADHLILKEGELPFSPSHPFLFTSAEETDCGCVDLETEGVIPPAGSRATGRQDKVEAAW